MTASSGPDEATAKTWLADEMLGRLARYLRFHGWNTEYVRSLDDAQVAELARTSGRVLLTRDRALAARVAPSFLLHATGVRDQLAEVFAAYPGERRDLRFDRCPEDNEPLRAAGPLDAGTAERVPRDLRLRGEPLWTCGHCGQFYWEGSHATKIRAVVEDASARVGRA